MKSPVVPQPEQPMDNLQLLLQRRAELARSKAKYALTETDAQLLGTHSTEVRFEDGQTIVEENNDITQVYRIRSGKAVVSRYGFQFNMIGRGWFIGDSMLIYDTPAYTMKTTVKAQGPVVLDQLNLGFVQQLFKIDPILKAKFMRHLVSKYSFIFMSLLSDLENPTVRAVREASACLPLSTTAPLLTATISSDLYGEDSSSDGSAPSTPTSAPSTPSSIRSLSSTSSASSSTLPGAPDVIPESNKPTSQRHSNRFGRTREAPYKSYPLSNRGNGIQTLLLKSKKIKVVSKSFGFSFKTNIEFTKIQNISKVGENAVTIVYQPRKVVNVFFKNYYDREEFVGLVNSLITPNPPRSPEPVRAQGQALTVPHNPNLDYDEVPLCGGKEQLCKSQQVIVELKKGDIVFEEGDLFQRVYTLLRGRLDIIQKGKKVCTMEEGDVFGVATLLYLRPCPVTLQVATESAKIVYIPASKLNTMLETDTLQAADLYQHAAQALDRQISRAVGYLPHCARSLCERKQRELTREPSDSGTLSEHTLSSEASSASLRDRSDSNASEGLDSTQEDEIKQEISV